MITSIRSLRLAAGFLLVSASCSSPEVASSVDDGDAASETTQTEDGSSEGDAEPASSDESVVNESVANGVDMDLFFDGAISGDVSIEDCTLSGGAETTCYSFTVGGLPQGREVGPFCPTSITDGAEAGGIWFDGERVFDVDGQFIADLPDLYGDGWLMHDEDGNVFVIDSAEGFEAAARPDVAEEYQNHCVEGQLEWLENGEAVTTTVMIPTEPVAAESASQARGNRGITLEGVVIAESAPVDAILSAFTIAAFDDCGGHFNPTEGYHMHGVTGCSEHSEAVEGETPILGYAMDGIAIHSPMADVELDECNGHATDEAGYHYHANPAELNDVLPCLVGQTVAGSEDVGGGPPNGGGPR